MALYLFFVKNLLKTVSRNDGIFSVVKEVDSEADAPNLECQLALVCVNITCS